MRIKYLVFNGLISIASLFFLLLIFQISHATAETSQRMNSNGEWIDQFDNPTLNSRWEWVREDPIHWSLTDRPGFLRIITQEGSLFSSGTGKNILLTKPTLDDYQISTKVEFAPTEHAQYSGLVVYQNDDNYIQLSRRFTTNDYVTFRLEDGENVFGNNITVTATTVHLRITKFNNSYIGEYSTDGNTWIEVDKYNIEFTDPKVGLNAQNGPSTTDIPSDFDYFRFNEPGETLYVSQNGDCGEVEPCYTTIQEAVEAANPFDSIKVANGTYTDLHVFPRDDVTTTSVVTQVVYLSKTLSLQGGYSNADWTSANPDKNLTTIDAQGKGRGVYITGKIYPKIEGFHITRGDATGLGGEAHWDYDAGGGIYFWESSVKLISNHVTSNNAEVGGGIYGSVSGWGLPGNPDCWIERNTILSNIAQNGGGISIIGATAWIFGNDIYNNQAEYNAGMAFLLSSPSIYQNRIHNNTASHSGGGISFQWGEPILVNNLIADNVIENDTHGKGSGISNFGANIRLIHNTIARNRGGDGSGINNFSEYDWDYPTIYLTNTLIYSQSIGIKTSDPSTITIDSILWHNVPITISYSPTTVVSVKNEYSGDPLFAADGYHLTAGSAAIDKGVDAGVMVDIDGESRPAGAGYDLGADELWITVYLPLVTKK